ncbi:MAG: hypothetical protein AAF193_08895, partial [Bacteroidota bacterium]
MRLITLLIIFSIPFAISGQVSTKEYLEANRQDANQGVELHLGNAKIVGYGALHGSQKTEDVEIHLLKELAENHNLGFYLPETDYSTAHYFQHFLNNGDEILLKDLVTCYGNMVPQEKSTQVFEKWKAIRSLFNQHNIQVLGTDRIANYKYPVLHLLSLTTNRENWSKLDSLEMLTKQPETIWSAFYKSETIALISRFLDDYDQNKELYDQHIDNSFEFGHVIRNLKITFEPFKRETNIFENYLILKDHYQMEDRLQFCRFGIFHIMKNRINDGASFFTMLSEKQVYEPNQIFTIQTFLT